MKFSLKWLQEHIASRLPPVADLVDIISVRAFEVEEVEEKAGDTAMEIKVLADRNHDVLSHRGMAREIAALLGMQRKERISPYRTLGTFGRGEKREEKLQNATGGPVRVAVADPKLCPRYIGTRVDGVTVAPSPDWLKEKLESIGQRSINNIVDITNYVLFDIGQPMHAFDAAKVQGGITVRLAKKGETMTTLDNKALTFDGSELVIADDEVVLALAGVKGGKKAEVDAKTTSIIFESANFHPSLTRRTSVKHGIKTDASKRFENGMTSTFAAEGMEMALALTEKIMPQATIGSVTDVYPKQERPYKVGVSTPQIGRLLGVKISDDDVVSLLDCTNLMYEEVVPRERIVLLSEEVLSSRYERGASVLFDAPEKFDCSSLVAWLFKEAGYSIPRISVDQFAYARAIEKEDLLPGDLVFTNTGELKNKDGIHFRTREWMPGKEVLDGIDHVGLWLGDNSILHASSHHGKAVKEVFGRSAQFQKECHFGRIIESDEKRFVVTIPLERLDLRIPEDLIEEIGRHYGYDKITPTLPKLGKKGVPEKRLAYGAKVRDFLVMRGLAEVFTYSFARPGEGDVEVLNPVGKDRPVMRRELTTGLSRALMMNFYNAPFLGIDDVRIFEIGNVFRLDGERMHVALGVRASGKKKVTTAKAELDLLLKDLCAHLGVEARLEDPPKGLPPDPDALVREFDLEAAVEKLPDPKSYESPSAPGADIVYKTFSPYPFIVRDIALFVPASVDEDVPATLIQKEVGDLVVRFAQFDKFQKPGEERISYAYRLVFQSPERTLTDDEVNKIMTKVTDALNKKDGWEVR